MTDSASPSSPPLSENDIGALYPQVDVERRTQDGDDVIFVWCKPSTDVRVSDTGICCSVAPEAADLGGGKDCQLTPVPWKSFSVCRQEIELLLSKLTPVRSGGHGAVYAGHWYGQPATFKLAELKQQAGDLEQRTVSVRHCRVACEVVTTLDLCPYKFSVFTLQQSQALCLGKIGLLPTHIHAPFASFRTAQHRVFVSDLAVCDLQDVAAATFPAW